MVTAIIIMSSIFGVTSLKIKKLKLTIFVAERWAKMTTLKLSPNRRTGPNVDCRART